MATKGVASAVMAALLAFSAHAADLAIGLTPKSAEVRVGTRPSFLVVIHNASHAPISVLDVGQRTDLRDNYARLIVTTAGVGVSVPRRISDPGPERYVTIAPDQDLTFEHSGTPYELAALPPGNYDAVLVFEPRIGGTEVKSNSVRFRVVR
jgi:hypothetical protein